MISVDGYVIMPNHIHLILFIHSDHGRPMVVPTISRVIQQMNGYVSKRAGRLIWQRGFYEHIIRSERDYFDVWTYIDNNPARWAEDKYYCE